MDMVQAAIVWLVVAGVVVAGVAFVVCFGGVL